MADSILQIVCHCLGVLLKDVRPFVRNPAVVKHQGYVNQQGAYACIDVEI